MTAVPFQSGAGLETTEWNRDSVFTDHSTPAQTSFSASGSDQCQRRSGKIKSHI